MTTKFWILKLMLMKCKVLYVSKLGRSKGADGLRAEHLVYGGPALTLWLKKIFNPNNIT